MENENTLLWVVAIVAVVGIAGMVIAMGRGTQAGSLPTGNIGGQATATGFCQAGGANLQDYRYQDGMFCTTCANSVSGHVYTSCIPTWNRDNYVTK